MNILKGKHNNKPFPQDKKDRVKNSIIHYLRIKILNRLQHTQTKTKKEKKVTFSLNVEMNTSVNSNLILSCNVFV